MKAKIVTLPGDGIGPEVVAEAVKAMTRVGQVYGHTFEFEQALIGGVAIDATGEALSEETLDKCLASDSVLMGAVGHPRFDNNPKATVRPEQGLLALRK